MQKADSLTSRAGREWLGVRDDLPILPAAGVFEPTISGGLTFLLVVDQGSHGRTALRRRTDFLGVGHVPEKMCRMKADGFRV